MILLFFYYSFRPNILHTIYKQEAQEIYTYILNNKIESIVVANIKGDGSETLVRDLPKDIKVSFNSIIKGTSYLVGTESRIYCSFYYKNGIDPIFTVETSKMWNSSSFQFGDISFEYSFSKLDLAKN